MKKYLYLFITLFTLSTGAFAQKKIKSPPKAKLFVDGRETDILVAKLIDPKNYASIGVEGISASDMKRNVVPTHTQKTLRMTTKPEAKFMDMVQFFERYKVPMHIRHLIDLL